MPFFLDIRNNIRKKRKAEHVERIDTQKVDTQKVDTQKLKKAEIEDIVIGALSGVVSAVVSAIESKRQGENEKERKERNEEKEREEEEEEAATYRTVMLSRIHVFDVGYMGRQRDVNEWMRRILIDWLVDVHLEFKLHRETFFLAIHTLDRFMEKHCVSRTKTQLVGIVCMLVAAKYAERHTVHVYDYIYICANAYTRHEILAMERMVLNGIGNSLTVATPWTFLGDMDTPLHSLTCYLLELSLMHIMMLRYPPDVQHRAALALAKELMGDKPGTNDNDALKSEFCQILRSERKSSLKAIFRKYSRARFHSVCDKFKIKNI